MIRIYKDNDTKVVTNGAFEQFYKPLGYNIVLEGIDTVKETVDDKKDENMEEDKETVNIQKKSSSNKRNKKVD